MSRTKINHKLIIKVSALAAMLFLALGEQVFAQRYSHDNTLGGIENVRFTAKRNGGTIEFNWNIQSTREITSVEVMRGQFNERDEISWELLKKFDISESTYVDYDPNSGKMFYKLVLIGKDGTAREYEPKYTVKGKS